MPSITVRNIPDDLYEALRQAARENRRSINSEIIICIERSLRSKRIDTEEILRRAQQLREMARGHPITDAELTKAKKTGRP